VVVDIGFPCFKWNEGGTTFRHEAARPHSRP
jgi:hypothetical protein